MHPAEVWLNLYQYCSCNYCMEKCGLGAYHSGVEFKYPFHSNTAMSSTIFSSTRKT